MILMSNKISPMVPMPSLPKLRVITKRTAKVTTAFINRAPAVPRIFLNIDTF